MFSVIFPGQGSQIVGMGKEFYDKFNIVKDLFKHTCLNIDTCYAIADHMNLVYYCQKKDEEPDTGEDCGGVETPKGGSFDAFA